jgi:tetratricopeptide (TPR) repeat protein
LIPEANISKQDAIAALSEFRSAYRLISSLQKQAMNRWSEQDLDETMGYTDDELAQYRIAREHLLRSLERNPFNPTVRWLLANAFGEIDDNTDLAFAYYNSSLELDPEDDDVLVARMGMHINAGRFHDASTDLAELNRLGSYHAEPMAEHLQKVVADSKPFDAPRSPSQAF